MAFYALLPDAKIPFHTSAGNLASGYKLYIYVAGTLTKATTYTDSSGSVANSNPITLNARGETPNSVYVAAGQYKLALATDTDTDPPGAPLWTADNISPTNYTATTATSEWIDSGLTPTYVSATSFTVPGNQTTVFTAGRRIKSSNTGGTAYSTVLSSSFGASTTVNVINDSTPLDSGLSAVSLSILAATNPSSPTNSLGYLCQGRLTLTSGTPVTTGDVTAATVVYFTPHRGNTIDLYDGSATWLRFKFSEVQINVPATASTMYDVFGYMNGATFTLEAVAWTNDTTRATALTLQDGMYVKSGTPAKRYLGSFRTTTVSGQTEDSAAKRYVWNYYNRVPRMLSVLESTASWAYTNVYRQANGNTANQVEVAVGVSEDPVSLTVVGSASNSTGGATSNVQVAIGLDSTTAKATSCKSNVSACPVNGASVEVFASFDDYPGIGRHYFAWLERSALVGTATWSGHATNLDSGISGRCMA